jgi:hypothetical protein
MSVDDKLRKLDDLVIAEILAMSEPELRQLVSDEHVSGVRADFEKARALTGKARLAQAKSAVVLHRAGARIPSIANERASAELRALRQRDQNFNRKLTLAARSGGPNGEADAASIEEDLAELDAWEAEDQKRS